MTQLYSWSNLQSTATKQFTCRAPVRFRSRAQLIGDIASPRQLSGPQWAMGVCAMFLRWLVRYITLFALFVAAFAAVPIDTSEAARRYSGSVGCLPSVLRTRLSQIRSRFGPVRIISTFRRGARIARTGRRSHHASCRAVDFHPPRGQYRAVVNWLKRNHSGGVGTYSCGMHHIHIDNGARVRYHHCVNRPGRSRRYAKRRRYRRAAGISRRRAIRTLRRRSRRSTRRFAKPKPVATKRFTTARFMRVSGQDGS